MSCFLTNSSLGKKLVMSITGCFLVLFILFHMSMNLVAILSPEGYNTICALLGANWYALAGTAVLGAGVLVHFAYALWLTADNYKARGKQRYEVTVTEPGRGLGFEEHARIGLDHSGRSGAPPLQLLGQDAARGDHGRAHQFAGIAPRRRRLADSATPSRNGTTW